MSVITDRFDRPRVRPPVEGRIIDIDQHLNETIGTWDTAGDRFAERHLHFRDDDKGRRALYIGDRVIIPGRGLQPDDGARLARVLREEGPDGLQRYITERAKLPFVEQEHPAASDPALRVAALDEMGIDAAVLFPTYGLFWSAISDPVDTTYTHTYLSAWNDWVAEQARFAPDRLYGSGQLGLYDPEAAAAEVYRAKELGLKGLMVHMKPFRDVPWSDESNEPVWRAFGETGMVLFLHIAATSHTIDSAWAKADAKAPLHNGPGITAMMNRHLPVEACLTDLIFGGVFNRHNLRAAVVECGAFWVPNFVARLDWIMRFVVSRNPYLGERLGSMTAAETFTNRVKVAAMPGEPQPNFLDERLRDVYMYSSDFPHGEGTAYGLNWFERELGDAPLDVKQRFYVENARTLLDV